MKNIVITIIVVIFLLVITFFILPFMVGAFIESGRPSYFFSLITGILTVSGMWQLFKGKISTGIGLIILAVAMFLFSQHYIYY